MSTIRILFDDLCAFFTKYPDHLMVGMIPTDDAAPEHRHQPHIVIRQAGVVLREYQGFDAVNGDISLRVFPQGGPLVRLDAVSADDRRKPAALLVDIENDLYPDQPLAVEPQRCRARFHFESGTLYTTKHLTGVQFVDMETAEPCPHAPSDISLDAGLDVEVPADGYAVLHFRNGTEDFIFRGGRDYEVEIVNRAEAVYADHFKYYYNLVPQTLAHHWVPNGGVITGQPMPAGSRAYPCDSAAFGNVDYAFPDEAAEFAGWPAFWNLLNWLGGQK
ncbi:MAG: hypothetical protein HYR56_21385 [Acidobacteria bacterium]|nr:hypothetical protein [Acidobacteriota bacterium]MBI3427637.1 hypothetical protein [Acidobacteriota bacterium]